MKEKVTTPKTAAAVQPKVNYFQRTILILQIAVVTGVSGWLMSKGRFPTIDLVALMVFSLLLWRAQDRLFILNFAPFVLLLLTYEALRGVAFTAGWASLHITDLIAWERALFGGTIPSHVLQQALGSQPYTPWLDVVANIFYMSHFVAPVALALVLWRYRRRNYWPFLLGLIVLSYAAFLTYLFFPAAPPWWASYFGYLKDQSVNLSHSLIKAEAILASANPVAAMPSLHAAYPIYLSLYGIYVWGKRGIPLIVLPLGVSFSAIYMGHHYVIDILAGLVYALVVFAAAVWWSRVDLIPAAVRERYRRAMAALRWE
jgi:membrane-associated phospholipid phosphatase